MKKLDITKLVFFDASSVNLAYTRNYGRALKGKRIKQGIKDCRFQRQSILATINTEKVMADMVFEGTLNKELFAYYLRFHLAPILKKDEILVMDNSSVHKSKLVMETIAELGLNVLFLPPYSPDFNPIELLWSKIKSILKKLKARTYESLINSVGFALSEISTSNLLNWFNHCCCCD